MRTRILRIAELTLMVSIAGVLIVGIIVLFWGNQILIEVQKRDLDNEINGVLIFLNGSWIIAFLVLLWYERKRR